MKLKKYNKKKTDPVKAIQVTLTNHEEVMEWCGASRWEMAGNLIGIALPFLPGDDEEVPCRFGDWVVELSQDNFYVMGRENFYTVFEEVDE